MTRQIKVAAWCLWLVRWIYSKTVSEYLRMSAGMKRYKYGTDILSDRVFRTEAWRVGLSFLRRTGRSSTTPDAVLVARISYRHWDMSILAYSYTGVLSDLASHVKGGLPGTLLNQLTT
jgi:hypothetical protein